MFLHTLSVTCTRVGADAGPVPMAWLDSFSMRSFTNKAVFDDTLPVGDGLLQAGLRVPLSELETAMQDWFRRKTWIAAGDQIHVALLSSLHE